jgi:hypothetical protein
LRQREEGISLVIPPFFSGKDRYMSTQNTTAALLEDMRESRLRDHTDVVVVESAETLIREAERATETLV